ncbi:MAG: hypothetical protein AAFR79_09765 [Pseudomonadota bacterium]
MPCDSLLQSATAFGGNHMAGMSEDKRAKLAQFFGQAAKKSKTFKIASLEKELSAAKKKLSQARKESEKLDLDD